MYIENVQYNGEHAIIFYRENVSKNTWTDWGLIPSSRFSEPVHGVWSEPVTIPGVNGQEDLVRISPFHAVNSYSLLRSNIQHDNRDYILDEYGFDLYQPVSGSLSFIIADQSKSFFAKQQEILQFLHNQNVGMRFTDVGFITYDVRTTVESFSNGDSYSSLSISYSVLGEVH